MKQKNYALAVAVILLATTQLWATVAQAHPMTERYIPIGQSPGVSGKYSSIGVISAVDPVSRTITVNGDKGQHTYAMSHDTFIWVDRNKWKMKNLKGSYQDCEVGRRVEIMYGHDGSNVATWIKVEAQDAQ